MALVLGSWGKCVYRRLRSSSACLVVLPGKSEQTYTYSSLEVNTGIGHLGDFLGGATGPPANWSYRSDEVACSCWSPLIAGFGFQVTGFKGKVALGGESTRGGVGFCNECGVLRKRSVVGVGVSSVVLSVYTGWGGRKCWSVGRGVLQNWGGEAFYWVRNWPQMKHGSNPECVLAANCDPTCLGGWCGDV